MEISPDSTARPVAGGVLTTSGLDDLPQSLPYEIWTRPRDAAPETWVVLAPPGAAPVRLSSTAIKALKMRVDAHSAVPLVREAGVAVSEGTLAVSVQQSWPVGATLTVVTLSAALLAVAVGTLRMRRRATTIRRIARHEVASRESERERLAREIHDGPLQDLALLARSDRTPRDVQCTVRSVGSDLRALAAGLRPPALDRFGLVAALDDLGRRWGPRLAVGIRAPEEVPRLAPDTELAVYRVAQEALTNTAEHGRASAAWVFLRPRVGRFDLVVRDDGDGPDHPWNPSSDASRLVAAGHFGLVGMAERARALGGTLAFGRGPGDAGAEVVLSIPIPRSVGHHERSGVPGPEAQITRGRGAAGATSP